MDLRKYVDEIQPVFNKVISHSQNIPEVHSDSLFEDWVRNKEYFYQIFGSKLIYEIPNVVFELDEHAKQQMFCEFVETHGYLYGGELLKFLLANEKGFFDNTVVKNFSMITREGKSIDIRPGAKITRMFKYFSADKNTVDYLQTEMSMLIQKNKVEGTLCFSIHPLDYLSSSENNYNWRSCHALDGEYRSGNLSYMADSSTVICYLKGEDDAVLPRFPSDVRWNNKKWRMLLFFSDQRSAYFAGRQYPFFSEAALKIISHSLERAMLFNFISPWTKWEIKEVPLYNKENGVGEAREEDSYNQYLRSTYVSIRGRLYEKNKIIIDAPDSLHFNDLLRSSVYTPYYCWNTNIGSFKSERFTIGKAVKCLCCGEELVIDCETMMCPDCEIEYGNCDNDRYVVCEICGERMVDEEAYWNDSGEAYCWECFNDNYIYCFDCDDVVPREDAYCIDDLGEYFCEDCYKKRMGEE